MNSSTTTALPAQAALRDRSRVRTGQELHRANSQPLPNTPSSAAPSPTFPAPERRFSGLSLISESRRHSVASTANDFILPSVGEQAEDGDDPSHWQSTPLAFAILPAIGGLFFTNGSAFITDVLLLGLAAIFLNWSVRLPWDWYHRAQSTMTTLPRSRSNSSSTEHDELATKRARDAARSKLEGKDVAIDDDDDDDDGHIASSELEDAAAQLRTHELFALLSTFLFPAFAAYLLHVIRGQLSRPSTGLVSDYNLTIFLLAAEIRPFRHLIKLVTKRTVYLQRMVNEVHGPSRLGDHHHQQAEMTTRLERLEAKLSEEHLAPGSPQSPVANKDELTQLSNELKKRYEPRIDALERALRRYEKRVTTLTIMTEQRLQTLQSKLDDALSLAAVAAQSSQKQGLVSGMLTWTTMALAVPVQAVITLVMTPVTLVSDMSRKLSVVLFGRRGTMNGTGPNNGSFSSGRSGKNKDVEARVGYKRSKTDRAERMEKSDRDRRRTGVINE